MTSACALRASRLLAAGRRLVQTDGMTRALIATCLALLLSGCGFQLRDTLAVPADLGPLRVVAPSPYSPLAESLSLALGRAGATAAPAGATDVATLELVSERWADLPLSIDALGRAQEYSLRYAVVFSLHRADDTALVPQQVVELARDYVAPPTDALGRSSERELLARELRREMSAAILRRIEAVTRRGAAGG